MTYEVVIQETLQRSICVEAETEQEAVEKVDEMVSSGELVLNADDFTDRRYKVAPMYAASVVCPNRKDEWVRRILAIGTGEDMTLQLNRNTFMWVERFIENETDTLLVEIDKGSIEDCDGEDITVFDEVKETYKLDLTDIRTCVDTLLDLLDCYVKPITNPVEVVKGVLGMAIGVGLISVFSVLLVLI